MGESYSVTAWWYSRAMTQKPDDIQRSADEILQEIRIVLPGTQALLGFQFVAFFNPVFQALSIELKYLHFATLIVTAVCSILLVAPVAFQQIGEDGRTTGRFLRVARRMLNWAMLLLLVAFTANVFLAAKTIQMPLVGTILATGVVFVAGGLLWYVHPLLRRR